MADGSSDIQKFITNSEETTTPIKMYSGNTYVYDEETGKRTERYYLKSGQFELTKIVETKEDVKKVASWHAEIKSAAKITKEQILSKSFSNKEILENAVKRITLYPAIKKMLQVAINNHFESSNGSNAVDIRSLYNLLKYLPEINSFDSEKMISIDADLALLTISFYKDNKTMHLVFDKTGEVIFNYSDNDMSKIRISGSSYFSGEISNASQIKKLFNMV